MFGMDLIFYVFLVAGAFVLGTLCTKKEMSIGPALEMASDDNLYDELVKRRVEKSMKTKAEQDVHEDVLRRVATRTGEKPPLYPPGPRDPLERKPG